jgi:hypothetical protein
VGLEGGGMTVQHRKCRRHYGIVCSNAFVDGKHTESESFICKFTGEKLADGQMGWIIAKGAELVASEPVHAKHKFSRDFWFGTKRTFSLRIFASEKDQAPQRKLYSVGFVVFIRSIPR